MLVAQVNWRNPFRAAKIPPLAKFYRVSFTSTHATVAQRALRSALRRLYRVLYKLGVGGTGQFIVELPDEETALVSFNARNTQFQSVYMPEYANGAEPHVSALIQMFTPLNGVFYDIGSNWGFYSVLVATRAAFIGHVHAFEPMPSTFADLKSVVRQCGLNERVTCHNVGISSSTRDAAMVLPDGLHSGGASVSSMARSNGISVKLLKLSDLGLAAPDMIKLDVEGHELEALLGSADILEKSKPMIVMENWLDPRSPKAAISPLATLIKLGYKLFIPSWYVRESGSTAGHFEGAGRLLKTDEYKELALIPFDIEQRPILDGLVDLFACHQDRLVDLYRHFADVTIFN